MEEEIRARVDLLHAELDRLDYYAILGVPRGAGHDDVRDAFYRLASELHPDLFVGEEEPVRARVHLVFKRVNEAYRTLTDPKRRRRYDEGLTRGDLRLGPEAPTAGPVAKEPTLRTQEGRRFYRLAVQAFEKGQLANAKLNFSIALHHEGASPEIQRQIDEVAAALKAALKAPKQ